MRKKGNKGKSFVIVLLTLLVLLGINLLLADVTHVRFIDYSIIIGVLGSGVIWYFTSSGGMLTEVMDSRVQTQTTNFKTEKVKYDFSPVIGVYAGLAYTFVSIIATVIYYKNYIF